jgi:hypothetical protein
MFSLGRRCVGRSIKGVAALVAVLAVAGVGATSALATTGQITTALVSPNWLEGDFAGAIEWTACAHPAPKPAPPPEEGGGPVASSSFEYVDCTWTAYATVGPGSSSEACLSPDRRVNSLGVGVQLVWQGEKRTGAGSASFQANDFPLDGTPGKVLCLATAEETTDGTELPCMPPGPPIPPGWHCPYVMVTYFATLDSRVLELPREPAPTSSSASTSSSAQAFSASPGHSRHRHRHRAKRRHRGISLSQHVAVSKK